MAAGSEFPGSESMFGSILSRIGGVHRTSMPGVRQPSSRHGRDLFRRLVMTGGVPPSFGPLEHP
jgi:hypothetical protein